MEHTKALALPKVIMSWGRAREVIEYGNNKGESQPVSSGWIQNTGNE